MPRSIELEKENLLQARTVSCLAHARATTTTKETKLPKVAESEAVISKSRQKENPPRLYSRRTVYRSTTALSFNIDVRGLPDRIRVSERFGASVASAVAVRRLKACKAVLCICARDPSGAESTVLEGVVLLEESLTGWMGDAGLAAVEVTEQWAEGGDAGCHNGEIEFEAKGWFFNQ